MRAEQRGRLGEAVQVVQRLGQAEGGVQRVARALDRVGDAPRSAARAVVPVLHPLVREAGVVQRRAPVAGSRGRSRPAARSSARPGRSRSRRRRDDPRRTAPRRSASQARGRPRPPRAASDASRPARSEPVVAHRVSSSEREQGQGPVRFACGVARGSAGETEASEPTAIAACAAAGSDPPARVRAGRGPRPTKRGTATSGVRAVPSRRSATLARVPVGQRRASSSVGPASPRSGSEQPPSQLTASPGAAARSLHPVHHHADRAAALVRRAPRGSGAPRPRARARPRRRGRSRSRRHASSARTARARSRKPSFIPLTARGTPPAPAASPRR